MNNQQTSSKLLNSFPGGFTVLMPLYNGDNPKIFKAAVDSVYQNTLRPNQFVLVVDGPLRLDLEFALNKILSTYKNKISLVRITSNIGLAGALNIGLSKVKYEWVVRADADDINMNNRFERLAAKLDNDPELSLIGSSIIELDDNRTVQFLKKMPIKENDIRNYAKYRNPFNHMSVAYKLSVVNDVGGYPEILYKEDYALWAKILKIQVKCANLDEALVYVSAGKAMLKRRTGWKYVHSEWELQWLLYDANLKGALSCVFHGVARALIFLMPITIKFYFYQIFLRKKIND